MKRNPKVQTALICIGEGAEATWYVDYYTATLIFTFFRFTRITRNLPGRAFRVKDTADIPSVLRSILSNLIDR